MGDSGTIGYTQILLSPNASQKALAMFGFMRSAAVTFATIFTGLFVKFGGQAIAQGALSMISKVEQAGKGAAYDTQTPEGIAAKTNSLAQADAGIQHANHFSHKQRAEAKLYEMAKQTSMGSDRAAHGEGAINAGTTDGIFSAIQQQ